MAKSVYWSPVSIYGNQFLNKEIGDIMKVGGHHSREQQSIRTAIIRTESVIYAMAQRYPRQFFKQFFNMFGM